MRIKRRKIKRGRIEIIPMIDTIVILLIFYMTFSRFAEAQRESALRLPESRAGDEFKKLPHQLIINMYSGDNVAIGGVRYKVSELPEVIRTYYANLEKLAPDLARKIKEGDLKPSIILRGDRDMLYKDLSEFMKVCAKTDLRDLLPPNSPPGITEVTFTALEIQTKP
ncbi:MAG: biopolymer transporter ExbD [Verrucomicrobiae bacterium]|nr:biopolymer transporter ExbD [Verrucomicrobiae bacterium]